MYAARRWQTGNDGRMPDPFSIEPQYTNIFSEDATKVAKTGRNVGSMFRRPQFEFDRNILNTQEPLNF